MIPVKLVRRIRDTARARIARALDDLEPDDREKVIGTIALAHRLGRLDLVLPRRERLIPILQQGQDGASGGFPHEEWHVPLVPVLLTVTGLRVLGAGLLHPVRELERILSSDEALRDWVESLDWSHPWGGPTGAGHNLISFTYSADDLGLISQAQLEIIRQVVDAGRDDVYGVWHRDHLKTPEMMHLGGAFATGIVYARFGWPLDRPEGTVKLLEEIQLPTGSWNENWPAGSADMDATWLLERYTRHDAALRRRAMPMLERCAEYTVKRLTDPDDFAKAAIDTHLNLLSILRALFPNPNDDLPPWRFVMFGQEL